MALLLEDDSRGPTAGMEYASSPPGHFRFIECPCEFCRLQGQTLLHPLSSLHLAVTRIAQAMLVQF